MTDLRKAANMALYALEFSLPAIEDFGSKEQLTDCNRAIMALYKSLAQPEQKPVKFLANGVRYKVTHQGYYGCSIVGLPENLNGQWVALVEATDSKHLNCTPPQELAKPEQEPDCGEAGHDEGRCGNFHCITKPAAPPRKRDVPLIGEGNKQNIKLAQDEIDLIVEAQVVDAVQQGLNG